MDNRESLLTYEQAIIRLAEGHVFVYLSPARGWRCDATHELMPRPVANRLEKEHRFKGGKAWSREQEEAERQLVREERRQNRLARLKVWRDRIRKAASDDELNSIIEFLMQQGGSRLIDDPLSRDEKEGTK